MPKTQIGSSCENQWEIRISVTVTIAHAAAKESHGRAEQRLAIEIFGLLQSCQ